MLPEFPIAQEAIQKVWNEVFFLAMGVSDPMISQFEIRVQKEGTRAFIGNTEIQFKKAHVEHQWKPEIGKGIPHDEFFARAEHLGEEMAKQQAAICFEVLNTPGPHNTVLKKTDRPFSFDDYLSSLEGMEIDFDAAGMPKWPTGFVNAEAYASVQNNREAWSLTEVRQQRLPLLLNGARLTHLPGKCKNKVEPRKALCATRCNIELRCRASRRPTPINREQTTSNSPKPPRARPWDAG